MLVSLNCNFPLYLIIILLLQSINCQQKQMNLNELLSEPDISVPQLFQQPDILNQIKYKIQIFVDFCKRNEDFTKIMITLGIKTPMYRNQNMDMRKVSHVASDFLTCDNDEIAELFVIDKSSQRIRCYSEDDDEIIQEIVSNQTTGELTIADRKPEKELDPFEQKYMYLNQLLSYMQQKYLDENCINYMAKVLNTVIRVKPEQVYEYFGKKPELLKKMIELTNYPSISYTIVKFINEFEDSQFRQFKLSIINMMIKQILDKVSSTNFPVYIEFIEEVFDKNRHRSEEQDELKTVTQPLVNKEVINQMLSRVFSQKNNTVIGNSLLYLLKVVERMNLDQEKDPYQYNDQQNQKPTMDFQVDQLFNSYDKLVSIAPRITREKYSPSQILFYYDLLMAMTHHSRFKITKVNKRQALLTLLRVFNLNQSKFNGIIKNKIVLLIETISHKQQNDQNNQKLASQIKQQLGKMSANHAENVCFKEKLQLLLTPTANAKIIDIHMKYSSLLTPTNFTQNRNLKIKQLQFVKKQLKTQEKSQTKPKDEENQNKVQNSIEHEIKNDGTNEQTHLNGDETSKKQTHSFSNRSAVINLQALNEKISAIKNKKQHKIQQQSHKKKQDQSNPEGERKQKTSNKNGQNESKAKKDQKYVEKAQNKEGAISYHVKHLILY